MIFRIFENIRVGWAASRGRRWWWVLTGIFRGQLVEFGWPVPDGGVSLLGFLLWVAALTAYLGALYMLQAQRLWESVLERQEAQLSPSDRAMRLVSSNLANNHTAVQKLLIRQVLTKPMVRSWRFSGRQCVTNKPTTVELCRLYHLYTDDLLWRNFLSPQCRNCSRDPDHARLGNTLWSCLSYGVDVCGYLLTECREH